MSCEDQALASTDHCTRFECQWWEGMKRKRPVLEQDSRGFWMCPKCNYSYGVDAKEESVTGNPCGNDNCNAINAGIDKCIQPLVDALNSVGLTTIASCCGHGQNLTSIVLADGRELLIAPDFDTARAICSVFPDIHGTPATNMIAPVSTKAPAEENKLAKSDELINLVLSEARTLDADQVEPFFVMMASLAIGVLRGVHGNEWIGDFLKAAKRDTGFKVTPVKIH